jgi:DNA-binding HxlR family transcriptional regulator
LQVLKAYRKHLQNASTLYNGCMTTIEARSECVICNVLELFGDKWTFLVVRDLFFLNKHEFKEFLNSPEHIATNVLTDRLKKLLAAGVINEMPHPENRSRKLYYLTEKGKDLFPILAEMAKWGSKHLSDLPAMKPLYERMTNQPGTIKKEIFQRIDLWEKQFLQTD